MQETPCDYPSDKSFLKSLIPAILGALFNRKQSFSCILPGIHWSVMKSKNCLQYLVQHQGESLTLEGANYWLSQKNSVHLKFQSCQWTLTYAVAVSSTEHKQDFFCFPIYYLYKLKAHLEDYCFFLCNAESKSDSESECFYCVYVWSCYLQI